MRMPESLNQMPADCRSFLKFPFPNGRATGECATGNRSRETGRAITYAHSILIRKINMIFPKWLTREKQIPAVIGLALIGVYDAGPHRPHHKIVATKYVAVSGDDTIKTA